MPAFPYSDGVCACWFLYYLVCTYIAQTFIVTISFASIALAIISGLLYFEQVVGSLTATDTFLGVVLKVSSDSYYKGINE